MANSNDLELSLKIQSDFKAAKADIKQLEEALQATSDQSAARIAKEIADSQALTAAQSEAFNRHHKSTKTKEEIEAEAAEATAKHEKEVQKLAAGLNKLLETIDPTLKGLNSLDEMESKLAASHKAGLIDEETYRDNLKRIMAQRDALGKISDGAAGFKAVDQSAKQAGRTIDETGNKTNGLAEQFNRLKNTAIAITGISFGASFIRGLAQTADEYSNLNARIKLVTSSNEQARLTFQSVIRLSNESSQSIASTTELYTRLARAMKDSASQSELLQVTSTINKAAVVSGATTQEASGAIIQLSQALASGVLRGQEFNSVAEQMPRIMEMLQKSLGKTQGELRKMAEQGLLTSSVVFKALKDGASEIDAEFAQMPLTISRATAQLANGWVEFVGGTNDALGVTKLFASVISGLAGNLSTLATAAVAVSVVIAGRKVAALLSAAQAARVERLETVLLAEAEMAQSKAAVAAAQAELARVNASRKSNIPQRVQAEQALTAALNQQAIAEKNLAAAKLGAPNLQQGLLGRMGSGLMGVLGGPMGIAITGVTLAVGGLTSAYAAAQEQERALEQQHRQTIQTLDDQTHKTYALIDAQGKLRQGVSTGDALSQQKSNANALSEDVKSLQKLQGEAANLKAQIDTLMTLPTDSAGIALPPLLEKWKAVNQQIEELQPKYEQLNDAQVKLSDELDNRQLRILDSLNEKGITYREVLDNMFAQGPMPGTNYMTELDKLSLDTEQSLVKLSAEMDALQPKLEKDLANATYTAAQQLELLRDKIIQAASAAGRTEEIDGLRERFEKLIDLQHKIDKANEDKRSASSAARQAESAAKATESYVKGLEKQAATMGKTQAQVRAYELAERGLRGALLQRAQAALAVIAAEERKQVTDANAAKNAQLQAQFMQASGDELGATLLTLRTSTNALRKEFTQTGNAEGLAWLDKLLPAQEAKARADALKAEIDRIQQLRNQQESRIQTQVDVGLISELNGRRQLVELHQQVGQQLQQHLPLMHEMAQLPGETGHQMQAMLAELENELLVLQSTTDELVSAFKDGFQDGVENTLNGLANGTLALSDAVLNLGKSVVSAMAQVASRNLASMAMEGLGGLFSSSADTAAKTASDTAGAGMYATSITTASTTGATMYATAFTAGTTALTTALTASFAAGATALATAIGTASAAGGASSAFSAGLKGLGMGFAEGGHVTGPGTKTSDSILTRLSDGEFVIKAAAVDKWGLSFLHAINQGVLPGFADGGLVSAPRFNAPKLPSPLALPETQSTGASPVNLQQKLILDPNEVLSSAMNSVAGERTFMTFVTSHKETLRQALGVD
ncbi:tape measure protein [Providencia sp. M-27]|uniref:tape measure protein n=1 Tax=Providencia sp. M-27 TaxID=2713150 RepID=UPI00140C3799|nr:tape measure protein [Providencia sp. M-27]